MLQLSFVLVLTVSFHKAYALRHAAGRRIATVHSRCQIAFAWLFFMHMTVLSGAAHVLPALASLQDKIIHVQSCEVHSAVGSRLSQVTSDLKILQHLSLSLIKKKEEFYMLC